MIKISDVRESDIGASVVYHREYCKREIGRLSSWNNRYVFVRFKEPNGEACEPEDVTFENDLVRRAIHPLTNEAR